MNAISLTAYDLCAAASLVAVDAVLSIVLRLDLHRRLLWSATRMVLQLIAVGYLLQLVFAIHRAALTVLLAIAMAAVAAREIAARPERRFKGLTGFGLSATGVTIATVLTVGLGLTTAIRPHPWFDPRYAIPLIGIVLGSVLNAGSLTLDTLLTDVRRDRAALEAQLALGAPYRDAVAPVARRAVRRGLVPIINQMSAAGVVTLPGIMTGQILAGAAPIEAVKYQILLMFLLAGASGVAAVVIAALAARRLTDERERLRLDRLS